MPKFHVIAGPDATPAYPIVRKIGPADLKDALAKGVDDFWAMPTSLVFLGLIYPIVGMCLAGFALPLLFPLMAGFALIGPFAAIGLYEISRRRELGLETSWAHAFELRHSPSIPSLLALGLLLLVIFICWEFTAQSLYVSLLGSTPLLYLRSMTWVANSVAARSVTVKPSDCKSIPANMASPRPSATGVIAK